MYTRVDKPDGETLEIVHLIITPMIKWLVEVTFGARHLITGR